MRNISAILPVLNEESLLPVLLDNIEDYVDEIIVVDGGPDGVSDDATAEIAQSYSKVQYFSDTFRAANGAWETARHKNTCLNKAKGEIILFLSADVVFSNLDILVDSIRENEEHKLFFTSTLEFWMDMSHLRLYAEATDSQTIPSNILQVVAVDRSLKPYFDESCRLVLDKAELDHRILMPDVIKYHLGWIRDFPKQVQKHITHVLQRRWGEHGEKLLDQGQQAIEQWAISHVLGYPKIPSIDFGGQIPSELQDLRAMKYNDGYAAVLEDFEESYGMSVFKT